MTLRAPIPLNQPSCTYISHEPYTHYFSVQWCSGQRGSKLLPICASLLQCLLPVWTCLIKPTSLGHSSWSGVRKAAFASQWILDNIYEAALVWSWQSSSLRPPANTLDWFLLTSHKVLAWVNRGPTLLAFCFMLRISPWCPYWFQASTGSEAAESMSQRWTEQQQDAKTTGFLLLQQELPRTDKSAQHEAHTLPLLCSAVWMCKWSSGSVSARRNCAHNSALRDVFRQALRWWAGCCLSWSTVSLSGWISFQLISSPQTALQKSQWFLVSHRKLKKMLLLSPQKKSTKASSFDLHWGSGWDLFLGQTVFVLRPFFFSYQHVREL